jgi:hypothetical protein
MLALADSDGDSITGSEKECALSWLEFEAFQKSAHCERPFASAQSPDGQGGVGYSANAFFSSSG